MTQLLPKELLDLQLQIDDIKKQLGRTTVVSVPNQALSSLSDVTFNSVLVGLRGTWLPVFAGTGTAGVYTYTNQQGYYYEISNIVFLFGRITISAIGTPPVGNMRITGLPFVNHATYFGGLNFHYISNFNYAANAIELTASTAVNQQYIDLREVFDNGATVACPAANFTNVACDLIFSGQYPGA